MKEKETMKLYNGITNVDSRFVEEAQTKKKKNGWLKLGAVAACLCLAAAAVVIASKLNGSGQGNITHSFTADAAPMICVEGTLYKQSTLQTSYGAMKDEFVYLGEVESDVTNAQSTADGVPHENFQANHPIVGSKVYGYRDDIVVEISGKYWLYERYILGD